MLSRRSTLTGGSRLVVALVPGKGAACQCWYRSGTPLSWAVGGAVGGLTDADAADPVLLAGCTAVSG